MFRVGFHAEAEQGRTAFARRLDHVPEERGGVGDRRDLGEIRLDGVEAAFLDGRLVGGGTVEHPEFVAVGQPLRGGGLPFLPRGFEDLVQVVTHLVAEGFERSDRDFARRDLQFLLGDFVDVRVEVVAGRDRVVELADIGEGIVPDGRDARGHWAVGVAGGEREGEGADRGEERRLQARVRTHGCAA